MDAYLKDLTTHRDYRGLLCEILKDDEIDESIMHIYFSSSKPGAVRGNHYHKRKIEWFSVVKGTSRLVLLDNESHIRDELLITGDSPAIIKIMPNVSHAIKNIGNDEMYLIAIANEVFDPEDPDTYQVPLVI